MKTDLINKMRLLEEDHDPKGYPAVTMGEISQLLDVIDQMIPALDLLQAHLARGGKIKQQGGKWWLFRADGEGAASGENLRALLVDLIFMEC